MESSISPSRKYIVLFLCVIILFCFVFDPAPSHAVAVSATVATVVGAILLSCGLVFRDEGGLFGAVEQFTTWLSTTASTAHETTENWLVEQAERGSLNSGILAIPYIVYHTVGSWIKHTFGSNPSGEIEIPAIGFDRINYYENRLAWESHLQEVSTYSLPISSYPREYITEADAEVITISNKQVKFFNAYYSLAYEFEIDGYTIRANSGIEVGGDRYFIRSSITPSVYVRNGVYELGFSVICYRNPTDTAIYAVGKSRTYEGSFSWMNISKDGFSGTLNDEKIDGKTFFYTVLNGVKHYIGNPTGYASHDSWGAVLYDLIIGIAHSTIKANVMVDYYPDVGVFNPGAGANEDEGIKIYVPTNVGSLIGAHPATVTQVTTGTPPNMNDAGKFRAPALIFQKFPFCIPYDIYTSFAMLSADPVTPRWVIPFKFDSMGINHEFVIDFKEFDTLANITRWFLSAGMMLGLILITRKLIRG